MLEFIKRITNAKVTWQLPRLTHFRPFVFRACLPIISNHILTFIPTETHRIVLGPFSLPNFPGWRNLLKRFDKNNNNEQPFTNFIKPNEIKMPQMPQTETSRTLIVSEKKGYYLWNGFIAATTLKKSSRMQLKALIRIVSAKGEMIKAQQNVLKIM